jgi:hypothetical protein
MTVSVYAEDLLALSLIVCVLALVVAAFGSELARYVAVGAGVCAFACALVGYIAWRRIPK